MMKHLKSGEELGHDEGGLEVAELGGDVPGHAEVGVLVDRAGDEAAHVLARAEDVGEAVGEAGGRLGGREGDLADVV